MRFWAQIAHLLPKKNLQGKNAFIIVFYFGYPITMPDSKKILRADYEI